MNALNRIVGFGIVLSACLAVLSPANAQFAKGSDPSWTDQMESNGYKFYSRSGTQTDPFVLLKNEGINSIRLRVWVNPTGGWNNAADALWMAKRAKAQGMRVMVDFHYSDSWADPGKQTKPAAWANHSISQLYTDVYNHTHDVLAYFQSNGVTVDWVQVGNEINGGMLWPEGSTSNFSQLAGLINSGYNAVKAVNSNAKVIIHLANGYDNATFRWFFDNLKSHGGKYDVIGMSHYPSTSNWTTRATQISTNMSDMISRYGKDVMVCEVGMDWTQASTTKSMLTDLINRVKAVGSRGLGVFYWEPECYGGWQGYTLGAFDNSGRPTVALDAFL